VRYLRTLAMPKNALIITDMLNTYDHEDAEPLAESVEEKLACIVHMREVAEDDPDTMVVYVNDNHDQWEATRDDLVERALEGKRPDLVEPIAPREPVPFLPKGRHSIFYETALGHLLNVNDVERIVLVGQVTEQCILYSALDGYIRGYEVSVPPDAVAHIDPELAQAALRMMETNLHADVKPAAQAAPGG
jgi:nicotinamidase-related amidase